MNNDPVWGKIEGQIFQKLSLKHNVIYLREKYNTTPELATQKAISEIKSGIIGIPKEEEIIGPRLFFRVVGPMNDVFSGAWWFDADLYKNLETVFSRIYFFSTDKKKAIRDMLRELLAISVNFNNTMTEVWALELPPGERLTGYSGIGSPQKLFGNLPFTEKGNRLLVGKARQYYFPVKNPLWIKEYRYFGE